MRWIFPLALFAALCACGGSGQKQDRPDPLVTVAPAVAHRFVDKYEAVGTATANEQVALTAPVTERITKLGFSDGDFVRQGQMIAVLAQGQEDAALASAAAQARQADQQLARISALRQRGFATKSSLDAQVASAASARAMAAEARASIADRVIRAPFSGFASLRRISVGAVVGAGTEIATISDTSVIKLDFTVPETMLSAVAVGQPVAARAAAFPDEILHGTIRAIDPVIDPATRSATLRAWIPNRDGRIKPGMLLTVALESRGRDGVAVPELALVQEGENRFVFLIGADGKVKKQAVSTGGRDGNLVEVTDGLAAGTRIVTEGVVKLSDGAKARVAPAQDAKQRKSAP